ncbi:uncharacterized protein [Prorops nasuta]|uniref:uncharacterized protein n=1 Tax=Prorops nasuta TaxID=863751 RepID=UPI0034CE3AFE
MPLERALELCEDACEMMREWRSVYLKTRSEIEACGKGARWEFNRKTLFAATDYIGTVASDLSSMVKVLIDFRKIFGPELKAVMHDPAQIDALSQKVDVLVQPIRKIDYDPLNEFNRDNWAATVSSFQEELATLEEEAKNFIDDCFDLLTSAQDGLTFLQQFAKPVMLRSIEDKLSGKYHVIVQRFSQEISEIEDCYNTAKGDPPLLKYQPSASGSIFWLRKLFHRLKKPVLLFRDLPELKGSDSKASTFAQYLALAKQMKSYEEEKYGEWHVKAEITITAAIRRSLLSVVQPKVTDTRVVETTRRRVRNKLGALRMPLNVRQRNSNELRIGDGDHTLFACNTRFRLNFDWELFRVVREAELMEQLGFQLGKNGSAVREIAVRSNSLRSDVEATESMIDKYNGILDQLEPADVELLRCALFEIEKCIEPGVTRFNWNSLNIGDYAKRCDNLLKGLSSQSLQINRIKRDLDEKILIEIGKARLYPKDTDASRELPTCKELFDQIKKTRYESLGKMSKAYADLTPMLTKLESMVKGTSTGRSSFMRLFYEKYENKVHRNELGPT